MSAIADIREEYIEEALPTEKKRRRLGIRVLAPIAACLCIVIALAFLLTHQGAIGLPGSSAAGGSGKGSDLYDAVEGSAVPYEISRDWMLEDTLEQVFSPTRVLYLRFTVTIPAGETAEVEVKLVKYPSVDFSGRERNRRGFDLAAGLGSRLTFTKLEAGLSGTQYIRILRQNLGFDPDKGLLRVTLDPMEEHYYMDLEAKRQN